MQRQFKRRTERNNKKKTKPITAKPIDKKWIYLIIGVLALIVVTATGISAFQNYDRVVARINGTNIRASDIGYDVWEMRQNLLNEYFFMFPEDFEINYNRIFRDGFTFGEVIRREAAVNVAAVALMEATAERLGVSLTDEDRQDIRMNIAMSWDGDISPLREVGIYTMRQLTNIMEGFEIRNNVSIALRETPGELERLLGEIDILGAQHILVGFGSFETEEEAENFANELMMRLALGEDFEELMITYSEDPGQPLEGYTFLPGFMVSEFEQGTRELAIGDIGGPTRSFHGFHIIRRTEPDFNNVLEMQPGVNPLDEIIFEAFREMALERIEFLPALNRV